MIKKVSWLLTCLAILTVGDCDTFANGDPGIQRMVLVVGAPGEPQYQKDFYDQVSLWTNAANSANLSVATIGLSPDETNDLAAVENCLKSASPEASAPLWLVFIGHGTFDGEEARFNLRGPDLTAEQLSEWLKPLSQPLVIINTASSSAPFLAKLSDTNRVVVTGTRSGHEQYYTRFGGYFAKAISSLDADLDKDGQVSVFEAFLVASRQTTEFYKAEGRLATEHALLDDNGDRLGTPADWFVGLRAVKKPKKSDSPVDGLFARQLCVIPSAAERSLPPHLRQRRDALERAVLLHRDKKSDLSEEEYYRQLDALLLELARLYESE
jgi:hypothetical protein